jgi:hypothetical protein
MVVRSVEASHDSKPMQPGKVHLLSRLLILRFDPRKTLRAPMAVLLSSDKPPAVVTHDEQVV